MTMNESEREWIQVAPLTELQARKVVVVQGRSSPLAVFACDGHLAAVDNRCPHMGFPLSRGTVQDGILTCPWHHARFDLQTGCTFDLFADDAPAHDVVIRDGMVYVAARPRRGELRPYYLRRLGEGLELNISLIQFKCLIGLLKLGAEPRQIIREIALFGARNRDDWASGLTTLTVAANIWPHLSEETAYLALCHGSRGVASDCADQPPRRLRRPLQGGQLPMDTLKRWLRYWTLVRHRDAAERTLLTAVQQGAPPAQLAELVFTAATDRFYADAGHLVDFANKAFELLDVIGWEQACEILPGIVERLTGARGGEENNAWRHPVDLVPVLKQAGEQLPDLMREGAGRRWEDVRGLSRQLLGDDPLRVIEALRDAVRSGARPDQLGRALACAAAMRIARFGDSNELGDWVTALHSFSYGNAIQQALLRCGSHELLRGVFHGAISVWLNRFLNIPPASLPGERDSLEAEPAGAAELLERLIGLFDARAGGDAAARVTARYVRLGHPPRALFDRLAHAALREDMDFHALQMLEAGIRQYRQWEGEPEAEQIAVAMTRYLAAFCPTRRDMLQRATIALRLHRGEDLYEQTS
jgi:nitrite reductase/ring-hydroxylating ferredoxin subunit